MHTFTSAPALWQLRLEGPASDGAGPLAAGHRHAAEGGRGESAGGRLGNLGEIGARVLDDADATRFVLDAVAPAASPWS